MVAQITDGGGWILRGIRTGGGSGQSALRVFAGRTGGARTVGPASCRARKCVDFRDVSAVGPNHWIFSPPDSATEAVSPRRIATSSHRRWGLGSDRCPLRRAAGVAQRTQSSVGRVIRQHPLRREITAIGGARSPPAPPLPAVPPSLPRPIRGGCGRAVLFQWDLPTVLRTAMRNMFFAIPLAAIGTVPPPPFSSNGEPTATPAHGRV